MLVLPTNQHCLCHTDAMGWKEFSASVIESIAWPVVVLVIAVLVLVNFRTQIRGLLARIKSVKGAGVEATFGEELNNVRDVAEALVEDVQSPETTDSLPEEDPLSLIVRAWIELESTIEQLYRGIRGLDDEGYSPPRVGMKFLLTAGIIPPAVFHTVSRLSDLRNKVIHGRHVATMEEAQSFVDSANDMVDYLVLSNQKHLGDRPLLSSRTQT